MDAGQRLDWNYDNQGISKGGQKQRSKDRYHITYQPARLNVPLVLFVGCMSSRNRSGWNTLLQKMRLHDLKNSLCSLQAIGLPGLSCPTVPHTLSGWFAHHRSPYIKPNTHDCDSAVELSRVGGVNAPVGSLDPVYNILLGLVTSDERHNGVIVEKVINIDHNSRQLNRVGVGGVYWA